MFDVEHKNQPVVKAALFIFIFMIVSPLASKADTIPVRRPSLGLVLSGGGAKGFAHIGALKVFEEAGLQFDYVGGTSMGSIVGGLYAMGYHPDSMKSLVQSQNWNEVMNDKLPRKYIPTEEKYNAERFILTFPFVKRKVNLKQGLVSGQRINLLLTRLTSPFYHISNFNELPVPFVCIGTDLLTGENVVLEKGPLDKAIRASMSIPSYFNPVEFDNRILIDGGVINNYPVDEVRAMGAEIIIGVDVQSGLHKQEDLNSLVKILDQVTSFYRIDAYDRGVELTDLFIKPELRPYEVMSFNNYDSIMSRGEMATRVYFERLKRLADSLNTLEYREKRQLTTRPLDSVFVGLVEYRGLKNVSKSFIHGVLEVQPGSWVRLDELEENIKFAYGSGFFDQINYSLQPFEEGMGSRLVIDAYEASSGLLGAGINYNSDYKASILLNATFKNVVIKGSKAFIDLNLGESPRISGLYLIDRGFSPGFGLRATSFRLKINQYNQGKVVEVFNTVQSKAEAFLHINYRNSLQFRTGAEFEYLKIQSDIDPKLTVDYTPYLNFFAEWMLDTYNKAYYPDRGIKLRTKVKYISTLSDNWASEIFSNAFVASLNYSHNVHMARNHTLRLGYDMGVTFREESPPPQHWFILGGQTNSNYFDGIFPFAGLRFIEKIGLNTVNVKLAWQYQVIPKFYMVGRLDVGLIDDSFSRLFEKHDLISGFGITFGYESFIGPVELSLMGSNISNGISNYINIGFWF
jgi:NTE family protein